MQTITTIGLDIAKSVFQVHGVSRRSRAAVCCCNAAQNGWNLNQSPSRLKSCQI